MGIGFSCPACGRPLEPRGQAMVCENGHSFDVARQGYVNLLLPNQRHSQKPGDGKEMVDSRRRFLAAGYYAPFREALSELAIEYAGTPGKGLLAVDAGCGEGYYTSAVKEALPQAEVLGLDISKAAVKAAAGKYKGVSFAVASSFALPLADGCCGLLTNVFSPLAAEEFARVLKPGGYFLYAVPSPRHLYGMKELLYPEPYENPRRDTEYEGFAFVERREVRDRIWIPDADTAGDLFAMTPYYWKTSADGGRRLEQAGRFSTEIGFDFLVYRRTGP